MNSKLTLSINNEVKEKAKEYAKANNTSISKIVEQYLDRISESKEIDSATCEPSSEYELIKSKLSPEIQQIIGVLDPNKEIEDERYNYLMKKYS